MTSRDALTFLKAQADATSWEGVAAAIGFDMALVYSWWRRGHIPEWRMPAVEKGINRMKRRQAA